MPTDDKVVILQGRELIFGTVGSTVVLGWEAAEVFAFLLVEQLLFVDHAALSGGKWPFKWEGLQNKTRTKQNEDVA